MEGPGPRNRPELEEYIVWSKQNIRIKTEPGFFKGYLDWVEAHMEELKDHVRPTGCTDAVIIILAYEYYKEHQIDLENKANMLPCIVQSILIDHIEKCKLRCLMYRTCFEGELPC